MEDKIVEPQDLDIDEKFNSVYIDTANTILLLNQALQGCNILNIY